MLREGLGVGVAIDMAKQGAALITLVVVAVAFCEQPLNLVGRLKFERA